MRVLKFRLRVTGLGLGFGVLGFRLRVESLGLRFEGQGFGFRVYPSEERRSREIAPHLD